MIKALLSVTTTALFFASCSVIPDLSSKNENEEKAADVAPSDCVDSECAKDKTNTELEPTYGTLGLAGHCTFDKKQEEGCFTCIPRDLPITICTTIDESFDPSTRCENDADLMTCKVKVEADAFEFDFTELTQIERIYSRVPFFLLGAKIYIGNKLEDNVVARDLVFATFDSIIKFKKDFFTTGDVSNFMVEFEAHLKKAKPDLEPSRFVTIKNSLEAAMASFADAYANGHISDKDFLSFAHKLVQALPPELAGNLLKELNVEEIMKSLEETGNLGVIEELINNAGPTP